MDTETDMHAGGPPGEHEGRDGAMAQGAIEHESLLAVCQKPVGRHGTENLHHTNGGTSPGHTSVLTRSLQHRDHPFLLLSPAGYGIRNGSRSRLRPYRTAVISALFPLSLVLLSGSVEAGCHVRSCSTRGPRGQEEYQVSFGQLGAEMEVGGTPPGKEGGTLGVSRFKFWEGG